MTFTFTEIFDDITKFGKKIPSEFYLSQGKEERVISDLSIFYINFAEQVDKLNILSGFGVMA